MTMKSFTVLYYKSKKKKHKAKGESKFDGRLTVEAPPTSVLTLFDDHGSIVFRSIQSDLTREDIKIDDIIQLGGNEIEILSVDRHDGCIKATTSSSASALDGSSRPSSSMMTSRTMTTSLLGTNTKKRGLRVSGKTGSGGGLGFNTKNKNPTVLPPTAAAAKKRRITPPQPKKSVGRSTTTDDDDYVDDAADLDGSDDDKCNIGSGSNGRKTTQRVGSKVNPSLTTIPSRLLVLKNKNKPFRPVPCNINHLRQQGQSFLSSSPTSLVYNSTQQQQQQQQPPRSSSTVIASVNTASSSSASAAAAVDSIDTNSDNMFSGAIGRFSVPHSIKSVLKQHQVEGLVFLWNILSNGSRGLGGGATAIPTSSTRGCILADEMGLGKTLQTIAVIAALHRRKRDRRFVVVTPSSLVNNWSAEFDKWMGKASEPKRVAVKKGGEEGLKQIKAFCAVKPNFSEVLIISYDLLRMNIGHLKSAKNLELLVVDEGHRLKNTDGSKTMTALETLPVEARLCITATPIQNNLQDLYTLVNFVCPGLLGDLQTFRRVYERPISASGEKGCTTEQKRIGAEQSRELDRIVKTITLRRLLKDTLKKSLPPRHDYLLFCRPTELQCEKYLEITRQQCLTCSISGSGGSTEALTALMALRKLCAHPLLLKISSDEECQSGKTIAAVDTSQSGKLIVLESLLREIRENAPDEKVVIVSNFTSTLTLIEDTILKKSTNYPFLRLDGSVDSKGRQSIVDTFNIVSADRTFALLLSSKSGGVGLNLIGANRLVLVDPDWNPSTDIQAMARVYRHGQKRQSFLYRLFTSGTVEEIIWQRQIQKGGLVTMTVDAHSELGDGKSKPTQSTFTKFSVEEIRDCFTLKEGCDSDTKNKLGSKWHEYGGKDDLVKQGCVDSVLLEMAAKDPSKKALAYVHVVTEDDVGEIESETTIDCEDSSISNNTEQGSGESDEEFEFDE